MKQFIIVISTVETRCLLQMGSRHPLRAATLHSATPLTCRAGTLLERTTSPSWLRRSCSTGNLTCSEQASDLFSSSCAETHSLCARKRWGFIAVDILSFFSSVFFYIQKSQWREQPAWKLTEHSLLPPLPSPSHQRTCSAQSHLWPAQASFRGVSTVRTQHCGATLLLPLPPVQHFCSHLTSS